MRWNRYPPIDLVRKRMPSHEVRFLRGHYRFAVRELLPHAKTIVVVRDPFERVISMLGHMMRNGTPAERIADVLDVGKLPFPANEMTRYLGASMERPWWDPIEDPRRLLRNAVASLETVDVLATTENMAGVEPQLSAIMGREIRLGRRNSRSGSPFEPTEQQIHTIQEHTALDRQLYDEALAVAAMRR